MVSFNLSHTSAKPGRYNESSKMLKSFWKYIVYPPKTVSDEELKTFFADKWVVVTGASSGIGEALTHRLINAKAHLYLISRNEQKLISLFNEAKKNGCEACYDAIDLRQREQLDALSARLRDSFPSVSYLFCIDGPVDGFS